LLVCVIAVAACPSERKAPLPTESAAATTPAPPVIDQAALLAGKLPDADPTTAVVSAQCAICHSLDYLTQQRLGEAGWKKTVEKMRKFGAILSDQEASAVVSYAGHYWNPTLPPRTFSVLEAPVGALPITPPSPAAKSR
jgi:mono/diheme cytochrome c family protein